MSTRLTRSIKYLQSNAKLNYGGFLSTDGVKIDGNFRTVFGFRRKDGILYSIFDKDFYNIPNTSNGKFGGELSYNIDSPLQVEKTLSSNNISEDKTTIIEMEMHPVPSVYLKKAFEDLIFSKKQLRTGLQNKQILILMFFGWEADYFGQKESWNDHISYYDVLLELYQKYKIPKESIIFLNSNLAGDRLDAHMPNQHKLPFSFYDNWSELETFRRAKGDINSPDYTFGEHFSNLKKNTTANFLRVNRTTKLERDTMLYWTYCLDLMDDIIFEHSNIEKTDSDFVKYLTDVANDLGKNTPNSILKLSHGDLITDYIDGDVTKLLELQKLLPLIASNYEKKNSDIKYDVTSNEPVPHDIYTKAPISYVFNSFPERYDYIFLNQTVFNPIYNFHPILFHANVGTLNYFRKSGYTSYEWMFDETYDKIYDKNDRLLYNYKEMLRVNELGKHKILDLIYNNQDKLIQNRNKLIRTDSINVFVQKIALHLSTYYKKKTLI